MSDLTINEEKYPESRQEADKLLKKVMSGKAQKDLIERFEGYYTKSRNSRLKFERQWYTNIAFYFGKQWIQWVGNPHSHNAQLRVPKAPPWRVRLVSNQIKPIIRGELAKLTSEQPQPFIIPASTQEQDRIAAKAAEEVIEHELREIEFNKIRRRATFWQLLCGTSFIKDWYDPFSITPSGQLGSNKTEAVTAFHLFVPDLQEEDLENQPYVIHAMNKSMDWLRMKYGKLAETVSQETSKSGNSSDSTGIQSKFLSALGINNTSPKDSILVKEIWIKPGMHSLFPNGLLFTWAGDTVLNLVEEWPLPYYEYPFTKLDHIPSGRFYAESVIPDLIPLQKEYNRTRSQIIESKNRMSKPQLTAAQGSVQVNKITSAPGLVVEYKPGFPPPEPIPLQEIPSYVIHELERIKDDMYDICSQHEVSRGSTPPNVEAATAISYLQEADNSRFGASVSSIEEAVEKIGRHILANAVFYWDMPRKIKVLNTDGVYESQILTSADIRGNTDLHVVPGSASPRSKAAKQAFIMELLDRQVAPPARLLRYLDMAEVGKLYEEIQVDARQADRENLKMAEGQPVAPNDYDNHEIHIEQHNTFRKKQEFEMLPDQVKQIFQQHVQMHQQVLQFQQGMLTQQGQPNAQTRAEDIAAQRQAVGGESGSSSPSQEERSNQ